MLHEPNDGTCVSAWDAGNVLFPAFTRTKSKTNRNCTPIEDLKNIIAYHNYMKGKGF